MAKLYVFGIGGTGSRVIKSLTMLLASGVKLSDSFDTIVPLIIDPDAANGDLNRTTDILYKYQKINNVTISNSGLFSTKIATMKQLLDGKAIGLADHFISGMSNTGQKFSEFIDYNGLSDDNKALIDLLFSKENLEADMTVGFKGNPNIGSIVLNGFAGSDEYREFCNTFNPGDAIFIINSIFGGTGASGFPLLLKNLRKSDASIPNSDKVSKAVIGGITYLPYFNLHDGGVSEDREIDSTSFMNKSKAALSYYKHAIFNKKNSLNSFYYLGDHSNNNFKYAEGKENQLNPAHFLEIAGALSIIDFTNDFEKLNNFENKTIIKEFGINSDDSQKAIRFDTLGEKSKTAISFPLSKIDLFSRFLKYSIDILKKNKSSFSQAGNGINSSFYTQDFYSEYLKKFMIYYDEWILELETNDVSFSPFHENIEHDTLMSFVKGKEVEKDWLQKVGIKTSPSSGNHIINELNEIIKKGKLDERSDESKFIEAFNIALDKQLKIKLK